MHVCYLTHEYPPNVMTGGIGSFVQTIARLLVREGHRVSVIGTWNNYQDAIEEDEGVTIYRIRRSRMPFARFLWHSARINGKLAAINRQDPIDLIEAPNLGFAFINGHVQAPKVLRMHGGHLYHRYDLNEKPAWWRTFQERRSFRKADYYISVGEYVGRITARLLGVDWEKVDVIHNFIDDALFFPRGGIDTADPNRLLFLGTVCRNKGIRELVLAVCKLVEEFPSIVLTVAGRDWKDPVTGEIYGKKELPPLIPPDRQKHFKFIGSVAHAEVPKLLAESGICVYPSYTEAMPVAWLETLAMGKALIGSDIGPGREVIQDGYNGLLCDPRRPDHIAEKIASLLRSKSLRSRLAGNARKVFVERFSTESLFKRNIEAYERYTVEYAKRQS